MKKKRKASEKFLIILFFLLVIIVILSASIKIFNIQVEGENVFWYAQLIQIIRKTVVFGMLIICGMGAGAARWEKIEERFEKIKKEK